MDMCGVSSFTQVVPGSTNAQDSYLECVLNIEELLQDLMEMAEDVLVKCEQSDISSASVNVFMYIAHTLNTTIAKLAQSAQKFRKAFQNTPFEDGGEDKVDKREVELLREQLEVWCVCHGYILS